MNKEAFEKALDTECKKIQEHVHLMCVTDQYEGLDISLRYLLIRACNLWNLNYQRLKIEELGGYSDLDED